jgi:oligopeptidase B
VVLMSICIVPAIAGDGPKPPIAAVKPKEITTHGQTRVDDFFWLREKSNPEVISYLEAENAYTEQVMAHTKALQERLFTEMKSRIKETDLSAPYQMGGYLYYYRTEEGQNYRIRCRKPAGADGAEEVLLDENLEAKDKQYFQLGDAKPSPDHSLYAYSTDTTGAEDYFIRIKELKSGKLLPDSLGPGAPGVVWAEDGKTLFYVTLDEAKRPYRLYRHTLGTDKSADVLVYEEPDDRFFLSISKSRSKKFLVLDLGSKVTSEVRICPADRPTGEFVVVEPRRQGVEYAIEHHGDRFFILTNDEAVNFRLIEAPVSSPGRSNWKEVIAHRPEVRLEDADAFANHLVVVERVRGLKQLRVRDLTTGGEHTISMPEQAYDVDLTSNYEFDTPLLRYEYQSPVTPRSVYDYDMARRSRELIKQQEVPGYDASAYEVRREMAKAADGVEVPITIVFRKGFEQNGSRPVYLTGYGSYGIPYDPYFSSNIFSLLDRGYAFALAHIRGGGDLGRPWYDDGKLMKKKNSFTDFIACGEHLIKARYAHPKKLAVTGGSAGGLLMGAVMNMRPDLFAVVIAEVPFVDVMNTMLDETLPLTVTEYEEWGNPNEKASYDYMLSYSPYDNVERKTYPHLLVTAGLNDPRVSYWEPAKWVARLRATKTGDNRLLLKTNMGAGHGGASGRYERIREVALNLAFVIDLLGAPVQLQQ